MGVANVKLHSVKIISTIICRRSIPEPSCMYIKVTINMVVGVSGIMRSGTLCFVIPRQLLIPVG